MHPTSTSDSAASYVGNDSASTKSMSTRRRRGETAREISHLLKQQWRPGIFALCLLITYITYCLFYFFDLSKLRGEITTTEWFREWTQCLTQQAMISLQQGLSVQSSQAQLKAAGERAQNACAWIAAPHVPWFPLAALAYFLPGAVGIIVLFIFGSRLELWVDLRRKLLRERSSSFFIMDDLAVRIKDPQQQRQSYTPILYHNSPLAIAPYDKLCPEALGISDKAKASQKCCSLAPSPETVPSQRPKQPTPLTEAAAAHIGLVREDAIVTTAVKARTAAAFIGPIRQKPMRAAITEKAHASPKLSASPETVPRRRSKQPIATTPVRAAAAYIGPIRESAIVTKPVKARSAAAYISPIRQKHMRTVDRHEPLYCRNPDMSPRAQRQQQNRQHKQRQENMQQMNHAKLASKRSAPRPEGSFSSNDSLPTPSPTMKHACVRNTEPVVETQRRSCSLTRAVRVVSPTTPTPSELISFYNSDDLFSETASRDKATHGASLDLSHEVFSQFRERSRKTPEHPQIDRTKSQNSPPAVPPKNAHRRF